MKILKSAVLAALVLAAVSWTSLSFAVAPDAPASAAVFAISGVQHADVMRFRDPGTDKLRIGWTQSTQLSRILNAATKESVEDGIVYYSVMFEKAADGSFRMEISYDFAALDGISKGIRTSSIVSEEMFRALTPEDIKERAGVHAAEFSQVIYDNFLKNKITAADEELLRQFMTSLTEDLLKTLPRDGIMIIRRWNDLAGQKTDAKAS